MLHELAPNFRCKCAINHAEFIEQFHDRIDDFTPYIRCTVTEYERLMQYRKDYPGKRFLWYICCFGASPNNFLRTNDIKDFWAPDSETQELKGSEELFSLNFADYNEMKAEMLRLLESK